MSSITNAEVKLDKLRRSANKRGIVFTLKRRHVQRLLDQPVCAYSGLPFDDSNHDTSRSIERINPNEGYTPLNVIPVFAVYNKVRGDDKTIQDSKDRAKICLNDLHQIRHDIDELELTISEYEESIIAGDVAIQAIKSELSKVVDENRKRKKKLNAYKQRFENYRVAKTKRSKNVDDLANLIGHLEDFERARDNENVLTKIYNAIRMWL